MARNAVGGEKDVLRFNKRQSAETKNRAHGREQNDSSSSAPLASGGAYSEGDKDEAKGLMGKTLCFNLPCKGFRDMDEERRADKKVKKQKVKVSRDVELQGEQGSSLLS
jgi:hypothetical protein